MSRAGIRVLIQGGVLLHNAVQAKKLLLSKWTASPHTGKEKHFLVTKLHGPVEPAASNTALQWIDIEAVHTKRTFRLAWRELKDASKWRRGWV